MDYRDCKGGHKKDNFWHKAKSDLIQNLMEKVCQDKKELRILNLGAGTGDDLGILNKFSKNYVVDVDEKALSVIPDILCVEKKLADACNLPYENNFFDLAVSFDVFEHVEDDHKAVGEVYRVLKQNGILVFTVPAFQFLFSSHDKALEHYRRYSIKNIKNLLSSFSNPKIFFWNSVLFIPIVVSRIMKKRSEPKVDRMNLPNWLNTLFYKLLLMDGFLIKKNISMPFGISIVGFCRK